MKATARMLCIVPPFARLTPEFEKQLITSGVQVVAEPSAAHGGDVWLLVNRGDDARPWLEQDRIVVVDLFDAETLAADFPKAQIVVRCDSAEAAGFAHGRGFQVVVPEAVAIDADAPYFVDAGARLAQTDEAVAAGAITKAIQAFQGRKPSDAPSPVNQRSTSMQDATRNVVDGENAIAIVGIGAIMPGANDAKAFWANIQSGHYAISDVPVDRWDPTLYFSDDRDAPDKTYSKIGGWVSDFAFNRKLFRMPPTVVKQTDPTQLVCLEAVREALADAGYDEKDFDRDRCAVILGNAMGGDRRETSSLRVQYPEMAVAMRAALMEIALGRLSESEIEETLDRVETAVKGKLLNINEDSMPGELANVIAGRVAQTFNLRGPNYVVDAACASSLAAIETAVRGLRSGQYDMAVTGGVDRTMSPSSFVKFSKIGALSPDGSRPFDEAANGFVMGEGAGILILKRLADAVRDGDQVYALIRGVGGSSDGRGKGITAPNPKGQKLAVKRAYQDAGFGPRSVSLIEAHGTSTPVGDPAEVACLREVFDEDDGDWATERVALGSVKSMIGHLKSAAAAASLVKVAFALKEGVLPPTLNVKTPNPKLELNGSRFDLQLETAPWDMPDGTPRRAGVSAFGFGGTNFHVALEEYLPGGALKAKGGSDRAAKKFTSIPAPAALAQSKTSAPAPAPKAQTVSKASKVELPKDGIVAFYADDASGIATQVHNALSSFPDRIAAHLLDFSEEPPNGAARLAIVFDSLEALEKRLGKAAKSLQTGKGWRVLSNQGVFFTDGKSSGKVAMLFPGQGSQYLGMIGALRDRYEIVRATFDEADDIMRPIIGKDLSGFIFPDDDVDQSDAFLALSQTEITQPAVLTVDVALFRLLGSFGLEPDVVAGHSLGEYGACVAAGVMSFADALRTVAARGTEMAQATPMNGDNGLMLGVPAPCEVVEEVLDKIDGYVVCANKNCPGQTIVAGLTDAVKEAQQHFEEMGLQTVLLPVSHAFHSKVVAAASEPLRRHLETVEIFDPAIPILTNVTGGFYPTGDGCEEAIRDLLSEQVAAPVEFIAMVEKMHADGVRTFIEVGPKRAQTSFVADILSADDDVVALYTNHPKKGDVISLLDALAELWTSGAWSRYDQSPRETIHFDLPQDVAAMKRTEPSSSAPVIERTAILDEMVRILCEKTGYDPDEIETDFELEADLGIDTVKQAEIMAAVREIYGFERDDEFRLAEYPSLDRLADYVVEKLDGAPAPAATFEPAAITAEAPAATEAAAPATAPTVARDEVYAQMLAVLCEKTGYDPDEIESDFELEADLGIDTVKQAEIMAAARELYALERDDDFRLAEYPSLDALTDYVIARLGSAPATAAKAPVAPAPVAPAPAPVATSSAPTAAVAAAAPAAPVASRDDILKVMVKVLCEKTGYDADEIETDFELEADLGIDTVKQAEIMASVREIYGLTRDDDFRLAEYPSLDRLADYVIERAGSAPAPVASAPKPQAKIEAPKTASKAAAAPQPAAVAPRRIARRAPAPIGERAPKIDGASIARFDLNLNGEERDITLHDTPSAAVVSGASVGLPGTENIFDETAIDQLLGGQNLIFSIDDGTKEQMIDKRIVRLVKLKDGGGEMREVEHIDEAIKLAGRAGKFDLNEFDVPERLQAALDETSQLAFAAGLLALRDAGLPLVPRYRETSNGKKVTVGWTLPESIGRDTGVIFASAFAGADALADEVSESFLEDYKFNHRFLLRVLGIANSRFAEYVGAQGPNLRMNNACASTTTAIGIAEDWIRLGRCKRVIILSADNASGNTLLEWIGSGFLATGAASTEANVEDAALPFDARRDGMVIGMGAVGMVVEADGLPEERGIEPICDILATRYVNSALHPTRLDVDHIASEVDALIRTAEERYHIDRGEMAARTVFVSHETYTPARGGSAAAEIESLRRTFGSHANEVVVANTKGFTGHAMGAGIEDVLAARALQFEKLPHIANFRDPDPSLGDLRLSRGGDYELDYALRLAAGFGSQLGLTLLRFRARQANRLYSPARYAAWLADVGGFESPSLTVEERNLRLREADPRRSRPRPVRQNGAQPMPTRATFRQDAVIVEALTAATVDREAINARFNGSNVVVVAGPIVVTELITRALQSFGAQVNVVTPDRTPLDIDADVADFNDVDALSKHLESFGKIDGIVNLLGFGRDSFAAREVEQVARHTFNLAKAWTQSGDGVEPHAPHFWVSVTGMGGRLGFDRATGPLPASGAVCGITKSLSREWPEAAVRVVDVPREGFYLDLGRQILAQVSDPEAPVEIGLIGGVRWVPTFVPHADILSPHTASTAVRNGTWLVTGGAKGITAEIVVDIASRFGGRFVLLGRTELEFDDASQIDLEAAEAEIRESLREAGERVTPMAVKRGLRSLESQKEILDNMARIRAAGASQVAYRSVDLANREAVLALVEDVSENGEIDAVIHGAGVEISRPLRAKTGEEFSRVFNGKALGALHLWEGVKAHDPRLFIGFSSVAGRFGNIAQADYSGANEVVNKLVAHINATHPETRAISIDWTAWDDVGMAVSGSMKSILEARGVELLPVQVGAPILGDLLDSGFFGELLVAGRLGDFSPNEIVAPAETHGAGALGGTVRERRTDRVVCERVFDIDVDRFLRDHVYQGTALVPGVMGYEMMTAVASEALGVAPSTLKNVRFEKAIKLHRDEGVRLTAIAERTSRGLKLRIETHRTSKTGRRLDTVHFTADVDEHAVDLASWTMPTDGVLEGPNRHDIYKRYFHTGVFQVLDSVPYVGDEHLVAYGRVPTGRLTRGADHRGFITAPMLREMAFQAAGLWGMYFERRSYLPAAIGRSTTFDASLEPGAEVTIRVKVRDDAETEHHLAFDVEVLDATNGQRVMTLERLQLIGHRTLAADEHFETFPAHRLTWMRMNGPEADALLADHHVDFSHLLDDVERSAYDRIISDRRRTEWKAARVAAKELVARWIRDFAGRNASLSDVVIHKDPHGAPYAVWRGDVIVDLPLPNLSLTHSGGVSIAALTTRDRRVGVDLEAIEPREESFVKEYFSKAELALCPDWDRDVLLAALWCVKESVSKALGLGLHLQTREIPVVSITERNGGYDAAVELNGQALEAYDDCAGDGAIEVRVHLDASFAFAAARFEIAPELIQSKNPSARATLTMHQQAAIAALLQHKGLLTRDHLEAGRSRRNDV